jgi:hypothetical protein
MGVDCLNLVAGFIEEMQGLKVGTVEVPRLTPSALSANLWAVRHLLRLFPCVRVDSAEPGDILVVRSSVAPEGKSPPGHLLIQGEKSVFHAGRQGATWTTTEGKRVIRTYRLEGKSEWKK